MINAVSCTCAKGAPSRGLAPPREHHGELAMTPMCDSDADVGHATVRLPPCDHRAAGQAGRATLARTRCRPATSPSTSATRSTASASPGATSTRPRSPAASTASASRATTPSTRAWASSAGAPARAPAPPQQSAAASPCYAAVLTDLSARRTTRGHTTGPLTRSPTASPAGGCVEIDECADAPCESGGKCNDLLLAYTCDCVPGFEGVNCAVNVDDCMSNPCGGHGTCTDGAKVRPHGAGA